MILEIIFELHLSLLLSLLLFICFVLFFKKLSTGFSKCDKTFNISIRFEATITAFDSSKLVIIRFYLFFFRAAVPCRITLLILYSVKFTHQIVMESDFLSIRTMLPLYYRPPFSMSFGILCKVILSSYNLFLPIRQSC